MARMEDWWSGDPLEADDSASAPATQAATWWEDDPVEAAPPAKAARSPMPTFDEMGQPTVPEPPAQVAVIPEPAPFVAQDERSTIGAMGRQVARGAIETVGLMPKGAAGLGARLDYNEQDIANATDRYAAASPAERAQMRREAMAQFRDNPGTRDSLLSRFSDIDEGVAVPRPQAVTPVEQRQTFKAGEAIDEYGRTRFPTTKEEDAAFWTGQVPRALGSTLGMAPVALAGAPFGALGRLMAGVGLATTGSGEAVDAALERRRALEDMVRSGDAPAPESYPTDRQIATAAGQGLAPGALDAAAIDNLLRPVVRVPGFRGLITAIAKKAIEQGVVEGTTEGVQQVMQNVIAKLGYNPSQEVLEQVAENVLVGGVVGVLTGGVAGGMIRPARGGRQDPVDQGRQQQEIPPDVSRETVAPAQAGEINPPAPATAPAGADLRNQEIPPPVRPAPTPEDLQSVLDDPRPVAEIMAERERQAQRQTTIAAVEQEDGPEAAAAVAKVMDGAGRRDRPMQAETAADVDMAAAQAAQPTPAQAEAGNYRKGHVTVQGLDIAIEVPRGGERTGVEPDGRPWSVQMPAHYGYLKAGKDSGDGKVDVFVGDLPDAPYVYVIDQIDPATGKFDEPKVMMGMGSETEAGAFYDASYSDGSGPARMGAITRLTVSELKAWLRNGNPKKPLAYVPGPPVSAPAAYAWASDPIVQPAPAALPNNPPPFSETRPASTVVLDGQTAAPSSAGFPSPGPMPTTVAPQDPLARARAFAAERDIRLSGAEMVDVRELVAEGVDPEEAVEIALTRSGLEMADEIVAVTEEAPNEVPTQAEAEPARASGEVPAQEGRREEPADARAEAGRAPQGEQPRGAGQDQAEGPGTAVAVRADTTPSAPLVLRIGDRTYPVRSIDEASRIFVAARDKFGEGASKTPMPIIERNGQAVGYISYNGRVWEGSPQDRINGKTPIYDPSGGPVDPQDAVPKLAEVAPAALPAPNAEAAKPKTARERREEKLRQKRDAEITRREAAKKAIQTRKANAGALDIVQTIAAAGGIKDASGDLQSIMGRPNYMVPVYGALRSEKGMDPDRAREMLVEAGFLPEGATLNDLYAAIDQTTRGTPVYSDRDASAVAERAEGDKAGKYGEEPRGEPAVMTFDEFSASRGVSASPPQDAGLHRTPGGMSKPARAAAMRRAAEEMRDWQAKRDALRGEYAAAVERGDVREPTQAETLAAAAAGPDDSPRAQAARRVLEKRRARGEPEPDDGMVKDAGEKIGGSRADRWRERGLTLSDLEQMSGADASAATTKQNVWKPDYAKMIEDGVVPKAAALVKVIYDAMAARPGRDTPEGRAAFVEMVTIVRDAASGVKTIEDAKSVQEKALAKIGWHEKGGWKDAEVKAKFSSIFKGRSSPLGISFSEMGKAQKLIDTGFPAAVDPWTRRFSVRNYDGKWIVYGAGANKYRRLHEAATKDEAESWARAEYERTKSSKADGVEPERPHLDKIERRGADVRGGRNITSQEFIDEFGFRGVEFGNWAASDERQKAINLAYEGLHDLASVLNIPPKAISLNGSLGLAFGARGGGRFAAHYEPGKLAINLTKLRGGGSLAHEWGHAVDHYLGELDRPDAYKASARGVSGWYGAPKKATNLRPELAAAFDELMQAIFKRNKGKAERVREAELGIEKTLGQITRQEERVAASKAALAKEPDRDKNTREKFIRDSEAWIAQNRRVLEIQRKNLAELTATPDADLPKSTTNSSFLSNAIKLSGKQGSDGYWARPTEMLARAFEAFVFDKIGEAGNVSQYLVQGVEPDRYAGPKYRGNPYPTDEERAAINAAWEKVVSELKTRDGVRGPGTALYQMPRVEKIAVAKDSLSDEQMVIPGAERVAAEGRKAAKAPQRSVAETPLFGGEQQATSAVRSADADAKAKRQGSLFQTGDRARFRVAGEIDATVSLTPQDKRRRDATLRALTVTLRRMAGASSPEASVVDTMMVGEQEILGAYSPADNLIAVSMRTPDPIGTVRHETIHVLRQLGLIDDAAWSTLTQAAETGGWLDKHSIAERWGDENLTREQALEEAIAEEFGVAMREGVWKTGNARADAIFQRISEFFRRVRAEVKRALSAAGMRDLSDADVAEYVFSLIERGAFREGKPITAARREAMAQAGKATKWTAIEDALDALSQDIDGFRDGEFDPAAARKLLDRLSDAQRDDPRARMLDRGLLWLDGQIDADQDAIADQINGVLAQLRDDGPLYQTAYHGTPHDFDKFSTEKIGTGEGAQTYGYGLYFASSKKVAEHYRSALGEKTYAIKGDPAEVAKKYGKDAVDFILDREGNASEIDEVIWSMRQTVARNLSEDGFGDVSQYRPQYEGDAAWNTVRLADKADRIEALLKSSDVETKSGRLYEVELAPAEDEYLLWDRPLSEQSEKVKAALRQAQSANESVFSESMDGDVVDTFAALRSGDDTGRALYKEIASEMGAPELSAALHVAGIRGIKYLDGSSRNIEVSQIDTPDGSKRWEVINVNRDEALGEFATREEAEAFADTKRAYNYVIFDDADVSITAKYQMAAAGAQAAANTPQPRKMRTLRAAIRALRGGDAVDPLAKVRVPNDIGWARKTTVTPRTIAAYFPAFADAFFRGVDQFRARDMSISELTEIARPYLDLDQASKEKVGKVIEHGRMAGEVYATEEDGTIVVENKIGQQVRGKIGGVTLMADGETVTLDPKEAAAYRAYRRVMDRALNKFRDQIVREWGFDPNATDAPKDAADVEALARETENAGERARLKTLSAVLSSIETAKRRGYVPFTRYGSHYVTVTSMQDGKTVVVHREHIEPGLTSNPKAFGPLKRLTIPRLEQQAAALRARLAEIYPPSRGFQISELREVTPASFDDIPDFSDLDAIIAAANLPPDQASAVQQAIGEVIQKRGFRAHFIKSRNIPGYSVDFERSLADYIVGISGYLARREHLPQIEDAIASIPATQAELRRYAKEWNDYIQNPSEEWNGLRQAGFLWYLSGRLSSALVNLSQIPMVTAPYLSMFASPVQASAEIARAYKDAGLAIRPKPKSMGGAGLDFFDPDALPADVREAVKRAIADGTLLPIETFQEMARAQGKTPKSRSIGAKAKTAQDAAAFMFQAAERTNRLVSFIAAYRLAQRPEVMGRIKSDLRANPLWTRRTKDRRQDAATFAAFVVEETQFLLGKVNRTKMMRGPGSVIFQFKSFAANYLELMARLGAFGSGVHRGGRNYAALAGMAFALFMVGGLLGLPGAEDGLEMIEALIQSMTGVDPQIERGLREAAGSLAAWAARQLGAGEETQDTASRFAGRSVARGPLREVGVDVSQRIGQGRFVPKPTGTEHDSFWYRAIGLAGIPGSWVLRGIDAGSALARGDLLQAGIRLAPEAIADLGRASQLATDGVRTIAKGRQVMRPDEELPDGTTVGGASNVAKRALGFQPTGISRAREQMNAVRRAGEAPRDLFADFNLRRANIQAAINRADAAVDAAKTPEARKIAEAAVAREAARMKRVMGEIESYNASAPGERQYKLQNPGYAQQLKTANQGQRETQTRKLPMRVRGSAEDIRARF